MNNARSSAKKSGQNSSFSVRIGCLEDRRYQNEPLCKIIYSVQSRNFLILLTGFVTSTLEATAGIFYGFFSKTDK